MAILGFPLKTHYFSGGAHLTEADVAALTTILNNMAVTAAAGGVPLDAGTARIATFAPEVGKTYLVDPTAGAFAVTLPTTAVSGDVIAFKDTVVHANLLTINAGAGRTIEGYTGTAAIVAAGASTTLGGVATGAGAVTLMLCGTVWRITSQC